MLSARSLASFALLLAALCSATGCHVVQGLNIGLLMYPLPVSPFYQKRLEDKAWEKERYDRVPILGPITSGGPPVALDPPSPDEVMRALERARSVQGGIPFFHEIRRDNIRIVMEPIADYVDDVRFLPLVGPVQQHHAHYKCTIYFTETQTMGWPIPHTVVDEDAAEVVYIDHNHLHMVGAVDDTETSPY